MLWIIIRSIIESFFNATGSNDIFNVLRSCFYRCWYFLLKPQHVGNPSDRRDQAFLVNWACTIWMVLEWSRGRHWSSQVNSQLRGFSSSTTHNLS